MIIAVDFDGTCIDHTYPHILRDVPHCVRVLKKLVELKHQLILYTMRSGTPLDDAVNWFKERDIPLYGIQTNPTQSTWTTSPKCYAELYIDDLAFNCPLIKVLGFDRYCVDWLEVEKQLINGK